MTSKKNKALSNHEIVTLAVYLLGGDSKRIDIEDVAFKANELAPGRFTWRKYRDQINIKNISAFLWDARKPKNGGYPRLGQSIAPAMLRDVLNVEIPSGLLQDSAGKFRKLADLDKSIWQMTE